MKRLIGLVLISVLLLSACSNNNQSTVDTTKEYEHIPYVSELTQEECFVCGENPNHPISSYWGEDNVGILNLNTFDILYIEINRYDDNGQLLEENAGYMQMHSISNGESYVHSSDNPTVDCPMFKFRAILKLLMQRQFKVLCVRPAWIK